VGKKSGGGCTGMVLQILTVPVISLVSLPCNPVKLLKDTIISIDTMAAVQSMNLWYCGTGRCCLCQALFFSC
jgi:hypothetical protein